MPRVWPTGAFMCHGVATTRGLRSGGWIEGLRLLFPVSVRFLFICRFLFFFFILMFFFLCGCDRVALSPSARPHSFVVLSHFSTLQNGEHGVGDGTVSYGLVSQDDTMMVNWAGTIFGPAQVCVRCFPVLCPVFAPLNQEKRARAHTHVIIIIPSSSSSSSRFCATIPTLRRRRLMAASTA